MVDALLQLVNSRLELHALPLELLVEKGLALVLVRHEFVDQLVVLGEDFVVGKVHLINFLPDEVRGERLIEHLLHLSLVAVYVDLHFLDSLNNDVFEYLLSILLVQSFAHVQLRYQIFELMLSVFVFYQE